ncbi:MAG: peptidase S1 [Deltaproteobacteria bacterium]|nr:MAG: peptidase S1 [Deltaproteobacteria bacterium]
MKKIALFVLAAPFAFASVAVAQDYSQAPTFGTVELSAGFMPDPHTTEIRAGGSINAAESSVLSGQNCVGHIADAPDLRLNYTSGSFPLIFRVRAEADTTLVINAPDGSWHCIDDVEGLNPVIQFATPASGQYDIWIGTYGTDMAPSTLHITEIATPPSQ